MSTLPTNLLNQLGHGSTKAAFCPICTHGSHCNVIVHDKEQYAPLYIEIRCLNCNQKYWVCRVCRNRRMLFLNYIQLKYRPLYFRRPTHNAYSNRPDSFSSIDVEFIESSISIFDILSLGSVVNSFSLNV